MNNSNNKTIDEARIRLAAESETAGTAAFEYGRDAGYQWAAREAHPLDLAFVADLDPDLGSALLKSMCAESSALEALVEGFAEDQEWVRQARLFSDELVGGFVTGALQLQEAVA